MPITSFPLGPIETNCHVVYNETDAVVVDPGGDMNGGLGEVLALLHSRKLKVQAILCTHFHFDHIYGVAALVEASGAEIVQLIGHTASLWKRNEKEPRLPLPR